MTAICIGFLMITLDATIVNVALPAIRADVGGALAGLQWVVNAYTVAFAALLLTMGALADLTGARRMFLAGLGTFVLASVGCALASSAPVLIAARGVQGVGAAMLLPASLALIVHGFPEPAARARALGAWGGMSGIGLAAGPVIGGLAVELVSWRLIFLVNLPVGALAGWVTRISVVETPRRPRPALDVTGQLLVIVALTALSAGFIQAGARGWSDPATVAILVAAVLAGAGFVVVERRSASPMLPPELFRSLTFTAASAVGLLFNFCLYGTLFVLGLYLQQSRGLSTLATGLSLVPLTVVVGLNAFGSGRLTAYLGPRVPMLAGTLAGATGAAMLSFLGTDSAVRLLLVGSVVFGFCSLAMPAMTAVAMNSVPSEQSGVASGVLNAGRQTGGALGVALLGSLLGGPGQHQQVHAALAVVTAAFAAAAALTTIATRRPVPWTK